MPRMRAEKGAADHRAPRLVEVLHARPQVAEARHDGAALRVRLLEIADDLDHAEHADHHGKEIEPVPKHRDAERVARGAAVDVGADEAEQEPDHDHGDRLDHRAVRQHHRGDEPEHHQREIVRRVELLGERGERRRERADEHRADAAGEERAERRHRERGAGAALLGHLVAVDAGDDRGRLARHVDQDRGGRAAILGAVVDAGQHHQRGERVEPVGDRQQDGDGRDRPDPGQHADERAEHAADQREPQVLQGAGGAETGRQVGEDIHRLILPTRPAAAGRAHRRK